MQQQLLSLIVLAIIAFLAFVESMAQSWTFWISVTGVVICGYFVLRLRRRGERISLEPYWPSLIAFAGLAVTFYMKSPSYSPFDQEWPFWVCVLGIAFSIYSILQPRHRQAIHRG